MRILIADDHHFVREAIATYLMRVAKDISCVEAADLQQVKEKLALDREFDIVLLDYRMPGMNGLAGLDVVRQMIPNVPVAIMSGAMEREEAVEALQRGACGILMKDLRGTALLNALRLIASGETYVPRSLVDAGRTDGAADGRCKQLRASFGHLTPREFDCVKFLTRGATNREIANGLGISEITVKLHLNSAFKKMAARNRSDAVRIALLNGINAL
jgi:DNA-binding NarL/FixJ family response regulator